MSDVVNHPSRAKILCCVVVASACELSGAVGYNATQGNSVDESGTDTEPPKVGSMDGTTSEAPDTEGRGGMGSGGVDGGDFDASEGTSEDSGVLFDVGVGDEPALCVVPESVSCESAVFDPWHAMGVGCPDFEVLSTSYTGSEKAVRVHQGTLGTHGIFSPREGERMVILSTGRADELARTRGDLGCVDDYDLCLDTAHDETSAFYTLPNPLSVRNVDDIRTCEGSPDLVGMGDCSNTLETEWMAGDGAYDYAELRFSAIVPDDVYGLSYQFAFFSAEYPLYSGHGSEWNDMYIAWLESEAWTGNISFDDFGNPISINGVFLDFLDAESDQCLTEPCTAPELAGFAMERHAGTRWLETVAPVMPGEKIEMVFSIFDLSDAGVDTAVLLDNVGWGCDSVRPITQPVG